MGFGRFSENNTFFISVAVSFERWQSTSPVALKQPTEAGVRGRLGACAPSCCFFGFVFAFRAVAALVDELGTTGFLYF